jgi:hypothetical protein
MKWHSVKSVIHLPLVYDVIVESIDNIPFRLSQFSIGSFGGAMISPTRLEFDIKNLVRKYHNYESFS